MKQKPKHEMKVVHSSGAYHLKSFDFSKNTRQFGSTDEWLSSLSDMELEALDAEFEREDPAMRAWLKSLSDEDLEGLARNFIRRRESLDT